jgi:hypothetical protein
MNSVAAAKEGQKHRSEDRPLQGEDAGLPDRNRRDPDKPGESPALQKKEKRPASQGQPYEDYEETKKPGVC